MDPNNNLFNTQNSSNFPFNFQNPKNYQFQNQTSNQPQNIPNYVFSPNFFMPSSVHAIKNSVILVFEYGECVETIVHGYKLKRKSPSE